MVQDSRVVIKAQGPGIFPSYFEVQCTGFVRTLKVLKNGSRCWKVLEICCQFYPTKLLKCPEGNRCTDCEHLMWHYIGLPLLESLKNGKMWPWKALKSPWIFGWKKCTNPECISLATLKNKTSMLTSLQQLESLAVFCISPPISKTSDSPEYQLVTKTLS